MNIDMKYPVEGYAVTHPILGAELFINEDEADKRISKIVCSGVKYPNNTSKLPAWIHKENNRLFWTPR